MAFKVGKISPSRKIFVLFCMVLIVIMPVRGGGTDDIFSEFDEFDGVYAQSPAAKVFDPLKPFNRTMFFVNDKLYFWVMKPVAKGYKKITTKTIRSGVQNFFNNVAFPIRIVNNILQTKYRRAGVELARFGINTTVGILGFHDPAKYRFDLDPQPEDSGQTFGHYRIGGGFPLTLPLFGPSNLRDAVGLIADSFLNPLSYIDPDYIIAPVNFYKITNELSMHLGEYESVKIDAIDPYTFIRDIYEIRRTKAIKE